MKHHSQKYLQQRKLLVMLPLLVLPFVTMIFWALGGGQTNVLAATRDPVGLNLKLPDAHFTNEDDLWDKLELYEQAERDSLKYEEARRNDPYYVVTTLKGNARDTLPDSRPKLMTSLGNKDPLERWDDHESEINKRLEQLNAQISLPQTNSSEAQEQSASTAPDTESSADIDRLEKMMLLMTADEGDPEMEQMDAMLDKILQIQHPQQPNAQLDSRDDVERFPVQAAVKSDNISVVEGVEQREQPEVVDQIAIGFFGLSDETELTLLESNTFEAVIHEAQAVVAGSTVKMRLQSDLRINQTTIPKGEFVYGMAAISGERLTVQIQSIRHGTLILPVSLSVFDIDGQEGIYIPGSITRDAARQASDQAVQDVQVYSMDNSLGVQAAAAGVEATKGLLSKKSRLITIQLKAGYHILLKDKSQRTQS